MKLCNDCVCRNQCGNDNVTFCAGYTKEVPTKWVTNEEFIRTCSADELEKLFEQTMDYGNTCARIDKDKCGDCGCPWCETGFAEWLKQPHKD